MNKEFPLYDSGSFKPGPRAAERHQVLVKLTARTPWKTIATTEHAGSAAAIATALNREKEVIL